MNKNEQNDTSRNTLLFRPATPTDIPELKDSVIRCWQSIFVIIRLKKWLTGLFVEIVPVVGKKAIVLWMSTVLNC